MPKYRISVVRDLREVAEFELTAPNADTVADIGLDIARNPHFTEWQLAEVDEPRIYSVTLLSGEGAAA
jgi:hypothetical protein